MGFEPQAGRFVDEDRARHRFKVSRAAFTEDAILARERRAIFDRCWIYLGHDSEIAAANDFVTRSVAGREIVFNRDRGGQVRAFLNVCPHRGATVVREKKGSALGFQCFYHGWAFNNNGAFATRIADGNYPDDFASDACVNLTPAPRLEHHRGLYFVNFDPHAPSLSAYLGDAKTYLDVIMDQSDEGMEIAGGTQEYSIRANWKLLVENSIDGYHAATTHATYFDYLASSVGSFTPPTDSVRGSCAIDLGNGHTVIEYWAPWGRPVAQWIPAWGEKAKVELQGIIDRLTARHGEARALQIARKSRNLLIFPNLIINDVMSVTVRTFYPAQPDFMNVSAWALATKNESAELRKWRLFNFLEFLGPGGFATPDDVEALEACQKGYRNRKEAGWNDISKGMMKNAPAVDDEEQIRCFWREWNKRVTDVRDGA